MSHLRKSTRLYVSLVAFAILFVSSGKAQNEAKIAVATMPFQASSGITNDEAEILTSRLNSELVALGSFQVLERSRVTEILNEMGFQQTGAVATDEYSAKVGKLLGVQYIITANVGLIGATYLLETRMVEVSTGKITRSTSDNYRGKIDGLLNLFGEVALKLAGLYKEASLPNQFAAGFGGHYTSGVYEDGGGVTVALRYSRQIWEGIRGSLSIRYYQPDRVYVQVPVMGHIVYQFTGRQVHPYIGGGVGIAADEGGYRPFGYQFLGGVNYPLTKQLGLNAELVFMKVPDDELTAFFLSGGIFLRF